MYCIVLCYLNLYKWCHTAHITEQLAFFTLQFTFEI